MEARVLFVLRSHGMSHKGGNRVARMDESCVAHRMSRVTYDGVMHRMPWWRRAYYSCCGHMSWHTYDWVWECHTYDWVVPHTWMRRVARMEACVLFVLKSYVMSHTWRSRTTHMDESCRASRVAYQGVVHRMKARVLFVLKSLVMSHVWMGHVAHMNQSCHTYGWVVLHMKESCIEYSDEGTRTICVEVSCHIAHMEGSCRKCKWVVSHLWIGRVAHMNEWCRTYEWVVLHIWMSGVARLNGSYRVATISRLLKSLGFFWRKSSLL